MEFETNYKRAGLLAIETSYPGVCSIYKRTIYFYPEPSEGAEITVRGSNSFVPLSVDSDEPALNAEYHMAIKGMARALAYKYDHDFEAYDREQQAALKYIDTVKSRMRSHREVPPRMMTEDEFLSWEPYLRVGGYGNS
jgi:hypothetical protein